MEKNNTNGFTLVEMMLCILVISIGLLAITKMQVSSIKGNSTATDRMRANLISGEAAEHLQTSLFTGPNLNPAGNHIYPSPDSRFTMTYTVTDTPWDPSDLNNPLKVIKTIVLSTTWYDLSKGPNVQGYLPHSFVRTITVSSNIGNSADNS